MYTSHATLNTDRRLSADHGWGPTHGNPRSTSGGVGNRDEQSRPEDAAAEELGELLREIDGLRRRLVTQPTIEQAKGLLVGVYATDADTAFAILVRWSQHTNTKLHVLAADLIAAASHAAGDPGAGLHRFLSRLPDSGLTARLSPPAR